MVLTKQAIVITHDILLILAAVFSSDVLYNNLLHLCRQQRTMTPATRPGIDSLIFTNVMNDANLQLNYYTLHFVNALLSIGFQP